MAKSTRSSMIFIIAIIHLVLINCTMNEFLSPLGRYSQQVKTQESQDATRAAYQATLSFMTSPENSATVEPLPMEPTPPSASNQDSASSTEPVAGMAGTWEYHYGEKDQHFYTMTIAWNGQAYQVTDCTGVGDVVCQIQSQSWDGSTFAFTFFFPNTGYTTLSTITGLSGDILSGVRSGTGGEGNIVWRRAK